MTDRCPILCVRVGRCLLVEEPPSTKTRLNRNGTPLAWAAGGPGNEPPKPDPTPEDR